MNGKRPILPALVMTILAFTGGTALAYEEPKYETVGRIGELELRRYAAHLVAETKITGDFDRSGSQAFRILAGYIFGGNQREESMAMTVPVTRQRTTASPAVPTETSEGTFSWTFVMPSKYSAATLPPPNDSRIAIREVPPQLMAVLRFAGRTSTANFRAHEAKLRAELASVGLTPDGPLSFAVYDGPFTPWFLRRNEVMAPIARLP
jgi:hypothetical protein